MANNRQTPASADVEVLKPKYRSDKHIWGIYITLCIISIVELYSASSFEVAPENIFGPLLRHIMLLAIGCGIILGLERVHYKHFYRWTPIFVLGSVALMIYVMFFGEFINGARRNITIMGFMLQPAEMLKISAVLSIAAILCKCQVKNDVSRAGIVSCACLVGLFGGLLFSQGLTNTLLLMAISISMMILSGAAWKKIIIVVLVYGAMGGAGYFVKKHYGNSDENRSGTWNARVERYLEDPLTQEIDKNNRQSQYSFFAQAHGGASGVFFGNSRETSRLPLAFSDFIYAIIVEELGIGGGIFVLMVYLWLLGRGGVLASRCDHVYPALLVIGMGIFITLQALFHMAIVTGVAPVSGQPLPLISKGGTSIMITSVALGIMLSVSRHALRKDVKQKITEDMSSLPESVLAHNPNQL